jgi:predicted nucleic acid-binding protein
MYLDANFFVFGVTGTDARAQRILALLDQVEKGKTAFASALVVDEVIWALRRNKQDWDFIQQVVEDIYNTVNLEVCDVPGDLPLDALRVMDEHRLKPRDALHVALMKRYGITEIASDDSDFDRVPGIKRIKV